MPTGRVLFTSNLLFLSSAVYIGGVPVAKHHSMLPGIADTTESLNVKVGAANETKRETMQSLRIFQKRGKIPREAHLSLNRDKRRWKPQFELFFFLIF